MFLFAQCHANGSPDGNSLIGNMKSLTENQPWVLCSISVSKSPVMSKECSPPNSKETSPQPSAAVKKAKPNLMSKSTGDISQLTKEPKLKMSGGGVIKSSTRISKLKAQQDLLKLTDKVDTLVIGYFCLTGKPYLMKNMLLSGEIAGTAS